MINKGNNVLNNFMAKGANGNAFEHLFARQMNKAEALRNLKNTKPNSKLDLSMCENIIGNLGKMGYVPGSKVQLIISKTSSCEALKDMDLNAQFLTDGKVDFFKLALLFPYVGVEGKRDGYVSIFSKEEYKKVTDKKGRTSEIIKACKDKVAQFPQQLRELRSCSQEDLVLIGRDLEVVATVMSELEIDAAKDESKRKGMIKIEDFMNPKFKQRAREIEIIHNFDEIVNYKKGYSKEVVTELVYEFEKYHTLFDFDKVFALRKEAFLKNLAESGKTLSEEEMAERISIMRESVREECMVSDPLFQIVEIMLEAIRETLNGLNTFYVNSDMKLFENLCFDPQRDEEANIVEGESTEEAVYSIRRTAVIVYEMINNIFTYHKFMSMNKVDDVAKIARNIVYTAGAIRGFNPHETFLIAVDAGWYKRCIRDGKEGLSKGKDFKYAAVKALFETELKYYFNADAMRKEAELQIPNGLLELDVLQEGVVLEFEGGQCVIDMDDDSYTIFRADDIHFTGSILLEADEEGYAVFVEEVNQYEFEIVDYVVFDNIANVLSEQNRLEPGDFEALLVEAETTEDVFNKEYSKYKLIPKKKSAEGGYILTDEEKEHEANRIAPILKKWCDTVALESTLGLNCGIEQGHYYLSSSNGVGKILGKVQDSFMQEDEYASVIGIATSVGAIVVKEPLAVVEEA